MIADMLLGVLWKPMTPAMSESRRFSPLLTRLVMIDYFQLLRSASRENNRQLEVSGISAEPKQLAKELSIPVIVVTQLTRQPDTGSRAAEGGRPRLSDLWEPGSLEQDADTVVLLVRPEYY